MAEKKIKILQVLTLMGRGGAETMVMNFYRALDRTKYQFDFLVHRQERYAYDDEIEAMGGKIYRTCSIRPGHYLKYFRFLDSFFEEHAHEYVAVHAHIQENSGFVLKYAAKYGIKNRLVTSHIADLGIDYKFPFRLFGKMYNRYITDRLACGVEAGKFLYGNKDFTVFPNAIPTSRFLFDQEDSIIFRKERGWADKLVIGNVSRFCTQKNHTFLLDVFYQVSLLNPNAVLVLVGEGGLRGNIQQKAQSLGLVDKVFFEGLRSNIPDYLKAFDLLLFPSLYEGLPVSIIEAQAAGLRCLLSDTIDKDVNVTGNVEFMSLKKPADEWAKNLLSMYPYQRQNMQSFIEKAGYDVGESIKILLDLYMK